MGRSESTRALLQDTALHLFIERGFDEVTVEDIASAAGVSHMTFYRHFPTKESAVLDDPYDPMIGAAVLRQASDQPPIERVRRGFVEALAQMDQSEDEAVLARIRLAADNRALRARIWENNQHTEQVIIEALAASGTPEDEACVAAGAVLGALTAALINWAREDGPIILSEYLTAALESLAVVGESSSHG